MTSTCSLNRPSLLHPPYIQQIRPPMVENLLFVSDYCFDADALINMEQRLMKALDFKPQIPTRHYFCMRFGRAAALSDKEQTLANYLVEMSLYDASFSAHAASKVSAAAVHLSMQMQRPRVGGLVPADQLWAEGSAVQLCSGYSEEAVVPLVLQLRLLHFYFEDCEHHKNLLRKWEKPIHSRAAQIYALRTDDICFATVAGRAAAQAWKDEEQRREKEKAEKLEATRAEMEREAAARAKERQRTESLREVSATREAAQAQAQAQGQCQAQAQTQTQTQAQTQQRAGVQQQRRDQDSSNSFTLVKTLQNGNQVQHSAAAAPTGLSATASLPPRSISLNSGLSRLGAAATSNSTSASSNIAVAANASRGGFTGATAGLQSLRAVWGGGCSGGGGVGVVGVATGADTRKVNFGKRSGTVP